MAGKIAKYVTVGTNDLEKAKALQETFWTVVHQKKIQKGEGFCLLKK